MDRRGFLVRIGGAATASLASVAGCLQAPAEEGTPAAEETPPVEGMPVDTPGMPGTTAARESPAAATGTAAASPGDATPTGTTVTGTATGTRVTAAGTQGRDATNTVRMVTEGSDYYFDPVGLYVEPGETITWVNESGAHSSTAYAEGTSIAQVTRIPPDAEPWNSGILSEAGAEFSHTFEVTGTYDYFCIPHKALGMIARLVVGEPGDVEGDPPDGNVPSEQAIVEEGVISYDEFTG